jgi:hypothetical protein
MAHQLTSREYRDAQRHIAAAQEHLRLAGHYVREDTTAMAIVAHHGNNLQTVQREMGKIATAAKEREETK